MEFGLAPSFEGPFEAILRILPDPMTAHDWQELQ